MAILDSLERVKSVGYVRGEKYPYPANFVFLTKDFGRYNTNGFRRVDSIRRTWNSLLKSAGLPNFGLEKISRHDLRRTKNVEFMNQDILGNSGRLPDSQRAQILGNSVRVNTTHYAGKVDDEILKLRAKLSKSSGDNVLKLVLDEVDNF